MLPKRDPRTPSSKNLIEFILIKKNKDEDSIELDIKRASQMLPNWYKDVPPLVPIDADGNLDFSIKKCIPVLDALSLGYFVVTKHDFTFSLDLENEKYTFTSSGTDLKYENDSHVIEMHPSSQIGDMPFSDEYLKFVFKWNTPWLIKTPKNYGCMFVHPLNWHHLPFYTLGAVVDTDKFPISVLFPFILKKQKEVFIPAGTPICQIIPFKKDSWNHKIITNVSNKYLDKFNHILNDYLSKRFINGERRGGVYKREYRNPKQYL
jgi:hypothetical protein